MKGMGKLICDAADKHGVDSKLVAAVIWQESRGIVDARRLENGFYRQYIRKRPLNYYMPQTIPQEYEELGRSSSWGLMQIMGETARRFGFKGESFKELDDPATNLDVGCKFLAYCLKRCGNVRDALLMWNGGGNQLYDDEVLLHMKGADVAAMLAS